MAPRQCLIHFQYRRSFHIFKWYSRWTRAPCTNLIDILYSMSLSINVKRHNTWQWIAYLLHTAHSKLHIQIIKIIFHNLKCINCYKTAEFWNIDNDRRCAHLLFECMNIEYIWVSDVCATEKSKEEEKIFLQIFIVSGLSNDKLPACTFDFIHLYTYVFAQCLMFNVQFALLLTIHNICVVAAKRCQTESHTKLNYQLCNSKNCLSNQFHSFRILNHCTVLMLELMSGQ